MWKCTDTVIYYIPTGFKFLPTVAGFSFINTLIKKPDLSYGKLNTPDTMQKPELMYHNIVDKIKMLDNNGASIIVCDSYYSADIDEIKLAFEAFQEMVECPVLAFFSTQKNKYSKPFTNIWKLVELFYYKQNKIINKNTSMYIGNLAGRMRYNRKKLDYNCIDRAFAHNISLQFATPELFFIDDKKTVLWEWSSSILNKDNKDVYMNNITKITVPNIENELNKLPNSKSYTVIVTGAMSCGKTTLAYKIKRKWDMDYNKGIIENISENKYDIDQLITQMDVVLKRHNSVLIDITCYNINIIEIIRTSMENKAPILIVEIKTTKQMAKLLDFMKIQTALTTNVYPTHIYKWKAYYLQYTCPSYETIPCVHYVSFPLIIKPCQEFWYEYA